jgi:hypothetical protein
MATSEDLWYSKFHKVIETKDSLTILSATERGVELGHNQKYGIINEYAKSVSIFAESVTLCDPDPEQGIVFGSTKAEMVTLSTTQLHTKTPRTQAVVCARGADGQPNETGGTDGRTKLDGQSGHNLNVFLGQSPSFLPEIQFDARGGHGKQASEAGQPGGSGGTGGHTRVLVNPTWFPIIRDLARVIGMLGATSKVAYDDVDATDDPQSDTQGTEPIPTAVPGCIVGIVRDICRLCQEDDPLCQQALDKLTPLCDGSTEVSRREMVNTLTTLHGKLNNALDGQCLQVRDSVKAPGGSGGLPSQKLGVRGARGPDGTNGSAHGEVWRKAAPARLEFAPLHPLQCSMQLEKATAFFYFGDGESLFAAQRILARLYNKIKAVLDLAEDDSPTAAALSAATKEARTARISSLMAIYEEQRELIGIPSDMSDPVGELRRIGRQAGAMLFQLTNTSVDYYGRQENWAPRQSVKMYQKETEASVKALKSSEELFLKLARRQTTADADAMLLDASIHQHDTGRKQIEKERRALVDELITLNRNIYSQALTAEIERAHQALILELKHMQTATRSAFEIMGRVCESLGNVAKATKMTDLVKLSEKPKPKPKPAEKPKPDDPKGDPKNPSNTTPKNDPSHSTPNAPLTRRASAPGAVCPPDPPADIRPVRPAPAPPAPSNPDTPPRNKPNTSTTPGGKPKPKEDDEKGRTLKTNFLSFTSGIWDKTGGEVSEMLWDGVRSIPKVDGTRVSKSQIIREIGNVIGDLDKVAVSSRAKVTRNANTNEIEIDEQQDKLLIASETQIDKYIADFVDSSIVGERAQKAKKILKTYSDLLADRNHDRVQFNLVLKAIADLDKAKSKLEDSAGKLRKTGYRAADKEQLSQMARLAEDIYAWNRARSMRLISGYGRAIFLQTLDPAEDEEAGGRTSDAAISLTAAKLETLYESRHQELFDKHGKAKLDPSPFPMDRTAGHGKYFRLTDEDFQILKNHRQVRVRLPAPSPDETLQDFKRVADVRIESVRFWLHGIKIKPGADAESKGPLVSVSLIHEGDSVYYHPNGEVRAFAHDCLYPKWSYRLLSGEDRKGQMEIVDPGVIIDGPGYAAPSPFASWTISIEGLEKEEALDLSELKAASFEFIGTNRGFWK